MAPTKERGAEDFEFIMTCLKHTNSLPKPDFAQVAAEIGAKSANTCYHRHWRLMNEWGLTSGRSKSAGKALKSTAAAATESTSSPANSEAGAKKRKRSSPEKSAKRATAEASTDEEGAGDVETPIKRKKGKVAVEVVDVEFDTIKEED